MFAKRLLVLGMPTGGMWGGRLPLGMRDVNCEESQGGRRAACKGALVD